MKKSKTSWVPAGWEIVCSHKLDGNGWRVEAYLDGKLVFKAGPFRSNAEADRTAKREIRDYAYQRLEFFAGQRRYHAGFGGKTLCGARFVHNWGRTQAADVDCIRCGAILNAIKAEAKSTNQPAPAGFLRPVARGVSSPAGAGER